MRATDTVARIGGDEFVIVSIGTGTDDEAAALVGRLRQALRRPYTVTGGVVELDASIGWAIFPQDGIDSFRPARARRRSDVRDEARHERRVGSASGAARRRRRPRLESALEHGELTVHYQPIVDIRSGSVRGVEALVRRVRVPTGSSRPSEFVPHIERTPLVRKLTLAVAADALARLEEWDRLGHELFAAVNVPYRMLDDPALVSGIAELLGRSPIAPSRLTIDVVPSGPGAGAELDTAVVDRLHDLGVRLSLDDLGRASSVAAIRMLPLDQVKIDAMFLHEAGRGGRADAIVRALVGLAHGLGLETVAEGVESRIAWEAVGDLGCDLAQGFYLGHPMPAAKFTDWLTGSWPVVGMTA